MKGGGVPQSSGPQSCGTVLARKYLAKHASVDAAVHAASVDLDFGKDGPLDFDGIDGLPIIATPRRVAPAYHDALFGALAAIGFDPVAAQEAENEKTIPSLVSASVGFTFVKSVNMQRPPQQVQFRKVGGLSVPIEFRFFSLFGWVNDPPDWSDHTNRMETKNETLIRCHPACDQSVTRYRSRPSSDLMSI